MTLEKLVDGHNVRNQSVKYIETQFPIERLSFLARREKQAMKPIYQIHTWFARRSGAVFRALILGVFLDSSVSEKDFWRHFYSRTNLKNAIILDPFSGGGSTIVEALKLNCKAIGVDLNPIAWFVTKKEIESFDEGRFDKAIQMLEKQVSGELKKWFVTKCGSCTEDAEVIYAYWVKKIRCERCQREVPLFKYFALAKMNDHSWLYCPHCRDVRRVASDKDVLSEPSCPSCRRRLRPRTDGRKYRCECGYEGIVLQAVRSSEKTPQAELFALQYSCQHCGIRECKKADDFDHDLYAKSSRELSVLKNKLPLPSQKITDGEESRRILNYGYNRYEDLFNDRQKLCLGLLLDKIMLLDHQVLEYVLLAFSNCLEFNNMLVPYVYLANKVESAFSLHEYLHRQVYVENNVWGLQYGRGTFIKCCEQVKQGKLYGKAPYERQHEITEIIGKNRRKKEKITTRSVVVSSNIESEVVTSYRDLVSKTGRVLLLPKSSHDLSFLPDRSIDAVITDPPYYDNVIYSGLSDLYYSWLRKPLARTYRCFDLPETPKSEEIVVNRKLSEKAESNYLDGLTRVYKECHRVLKPNGLMAFTFHHTKAKAWSSILQAVLDAGFYVVSAWPVHSESRSYGHVQGKKAILFDVVLTLRKRISDGEEVEWDDLTKSIEKRADELMHRFSKTVPITRKEDAFTVILGKCLELYSVHYPKVIDRGRPLRISEAIDRIEELSEPFAEKWAKAQPTFKDLLDLTAYLRPEDNK